MSNNNLSGMLAELLLRDAFRFDIPSSHDENAARPIGVARSRESSAQPSIVPDPELLARIRLGDVGAFETMFRDLYLPLCDFAQSYVRSSADAEDLVATVFTRIWAQRTHWDAPAGVRAYLFRAVRNGALNHLRDARLRLDAEPYEPAPSDGAAMAVEQADAIQAVWAAAAKLVPMQRLILSLKFRHELSWEEIVVVTGLSHAAAVKQYGRGMDRLKQLLRAHRH
jgi:RNA polymerase sigma-70 factor (ECF subfamily)